MDDLPYQIFSPTGQPLMEAPESCRYPVRIEKDMLDAGYTIRLYGKRLTKTDIRKEADNGNNQKKFKYRI